MDFTKMLHKFTVVPSLTDELVALQRVAYNLWWCWEPDAINLFRRLDAELWQATRHNPVEMLGILQQTTLESLKSDEGFMAHLRMVDEKLSDYLAEKTWFQKTCNGSSQMKVAYFSMEFGLHEIAAGLFRRSGHPGRRPPQIRLRPGRCPWWAWACSTAGLLPPVSQQ